MNVLAVVWNLLWWTDSLLNKVWIWDGNISILLSAKSVFWFEFRFICIE